MNIQIFGKKKCQNTKKAERFFKERNIPFQSIDLTKKPISLGELNSVLTQLSMDDLVNENHKLYHESLYPYTSDLDQKKNILQDFSEILNTPIVRNQKKATLGYAPEVWKAWIK